jgi:hypothetical protein
MPRGRLLTGPLVAVGVIFAAPQVPPPVHTTSNNFGDRTAAWLLRPASPTPARRRPEWATWSRS